MTHETIDLSQNPRPQLRSLKMWRENNKRPKFKQSSKSMGWLGVRGGAGRSNKTQKRSKKVIRVDDAVVRVVILLKCLDHVQHFGWEFMAISMKGGNPVNNFLTTKYVLSSGFATKFVSEEKVSTRWSMKKQVLNLFDAIKNINRQMPPIP